MTEKQVIVNWYTPEEKMPPEERIVVVTISGKDGNYTYDHALELANWMNDGHGWIVFGMSESAEYVVNAWCDLPPYGFGKGGLEI